MHTHICSTQAAAPRRDNHTYNWGPGKVLCKEHILLLLSTCHLVRRWVVVAVGAMLQSDCLRRAEGRVYPGRDAGPTE